MIENLLDFSMGAGEFSLLIPASQTFKNTSTIVGMGELSASDPHDIQSLKNQPTITIAEPRHSSIPNH
jgi:hypothetical protein